MRKFVVYAFCREDGTFYYIGKGSKKRAHSKRVHGINPPKNKEQVLILHSGLDEKTAFDYERKLILFYGRKDLGTGLLRNMTDGGEGVSGWIPSAEWRDKKRASMRGEGNPFYGRTHTQATKDAISRKNKGRLVGEKNHMFGRRLTGEQNPMFGKSRPDLARRNKERPSCTGTRWYTNGIETRRCVKGQQPDGFWLGRSATKKSEKSDEL